MSSPTIVMIFLFYFSCLSKCEAMSHHGFVYGAHQMPSPGLACGEQRGEGAIIFAIGGITAQSGRRLIDTFFIPALITMCEAMSGLDIKRDTEVGKVHILTISTLKDSFNEEYKTFTGSLSVCPFIHPSIQSSIHPMTKHSTSNPSKHLPIHLPTHSFNYPPNQPHYPSIFLKHASFHPFNHPPNHLSLQSCIHPTTKHLTISPPNHRPIFLSIQPPTCPSIQPSIHSCIHPFIHLSIHPSNFLSTHPTIRPAVHPSNRLSTLSIHLLNHPSFQLPTI